MHRRRRKRRDLRIGQTPATPMRLIQPDERLVYAQRILLFLEGEQTHLDRVVRSLDTWATDRNGAIDWYTHEDRLHPDLVLENHAMLAPSTQRRGILYSVDRALGLGAPDLVQRIKIAAAGGTAEAPVPYTGQVRFSLWTPAVGEIIELALSDALRNAAVLAWPAGAAAAAAADAAAPLLKKLKAIPWGMIAGIAAGIAGLGAVGLVVYAAKK